MSDIGRRRRRTWFDALIDALAVVAGAVMVALTVLICLDVAARYFRLFAMPWSVDVSEYALLIVTFLGAPWVLVTGGHISIDIFVRTLSLPARRRVALLCHALGALICSVLLVYSVWAWWNSFSQGTLVYETFVYPEWLLFTVPPPVFLILLGIFLRWLHHPPEGLAGASSDGI